MFVRLTNCANLVTFSKKDTRLYNPMTELFWECPCPNLGFSSLNFGLIFKNIGYLLSRWSLGFTNVSRNQLHW